MKRHTRFGGWPTDAAVAAVVIGLWTHVLGDNWGRGMIMELRCRPRQLRRRIIALCAMLVITGTAAAAVCAPARADTTDEVFLLTLDRQGIGYPSRAYALRAGWAVCHELDNGTPVMVVIYGLSKVSYLGPAEAGYFVGASIGAFCPYHADQINYT